LAILPRRWRALAIALFRRGLVSVAFAVAAAVTLALAIAITITLAIALVRRRLAIALAVALAVLAARALAIAGTRPTATATAAATAAATATAVVRIDANRTGNRIAGIIHGYVLTAVGRRVRGAAATTGPTAAATTTTTTDSAAAAMTMMPVVVPVFNHHVVAAVIAHDHRSMVDVVDVVGAFVDHHRVIDIHRASRFDHVRRLLDIRWLADDDVLARNIYRARRRMNDFPGNRPHDFRLHDCRRGRHHRSGRRCDGQGDLVEQRLTMAEAVEVQTRQAAPMAFEDQEFLLLVVAPVLADFIAALVDDAELVAILQHRRIVVLHFNVQVLLRTCRCRCRRSGTGLIEPRYSLVMPRRTELNARAWVCGLCDRHAPHHCGYRK
jgi:hypothetical protein